MYTLIAVYPDYTLAHQVTQSLNSLVTGELAISYVEEQFDQNADGIGGYFPGVTEDLFIAPTYPSTTLQEVPQLSALSAPGNDRTSPGTIERLKGYAIPPDDVQRISALVQQGNVACVIQCEQPETVSASLQAGSLFLRVYRQPQG